MFEVNLEYHAIILRLIILITVHFPFLEINLLFDNLNYSESDLLNNLQNLFIELFIPNANQTNNENHYLVNQISIHILSLQEFVIFFLKDQYQD